MHYLRNITLTIALLLVTGCSVKGQKYTPDFNAINNLKNENLKSISVKSSNSESKNLMEISLRAAKMTSPYGGSFSKYLEESLKEHLKHASLYNESSNIKVAVLMLKNNVDIMGFSIGEADISAKFTVYKNNKIIHNKVYSIHHTWDSSFIGQVAIENALNNYPIAIQKLINKFTLNQDFLKKIKK